MVSVINRTTMDQVQVILPTCTTLTTPQIQAAMDAATCIIDRLSVSCSNELSEACLIQTETYLSAHFAAVTENTLSLASEKDSCSGSTVSYGFKFSEGIKGTPFGQMANTLSGGYLMEEDKPPVSLFSIGSI